MSVTLLRVTQLVMVSLQITKGVTITAKVCSEKP